MDPATFDAIVRGTLGVLAAGAIAWLASIRLRHIDTDDAADPGLD